MKRYHVINPTAGHGQASAALPDYQCPGDILYETRAVNDARRYICDCCKSDRENPHFYVYGGDGTLNEAVNGILDAGAGDRALLSVIPCGTGNDFVRIFEKEAPGSEHRMDLISVNGMAAANMLNIGFDCAVVARTAELKEKPFIRGSAAYLLGVLDVLRHKLGLELSVEWEDENGRMHSRNGQMLLCAVANAQFCGGGFQAAPTASVKDGVLELLMANVLSRMQFLRLVRYYHDGTHIMENGEPIPEYRSILQYVRCRRVTISGMQKLCCDGEIQSVSKAEISVLPAAVRYYVPQKLH